MEKQTGSQRLLRIFSVLQFISAIVFILLMAFVFYGMSKVDISTKVEDKTGMIIDIVKLIINTILLLISWYILKKTSVDASKHNDALIITLVLIAFEIMNFITSLDRGVPSNLVAMVTSVLINMVVLFVVNNVKKEYLNQKNN